MKRVRRGDPLQLLGNLFKIEDAQEMMLAIMALLNDFSCHIAIVESRDDRDEHHEGAESADRLEALYATVARIVVVTNEVVLWLLSFGRDPWKASLRCYDTCLQSRTVRRGQKRERVTFSKAHFQSSFFLPSFG